MMSLLSITGTFYSLAIWICSGIYKVTAYAFKIFLILSRGNLLSSDSYQQLIENFYAVLGVVMLFAIAFALLRGMINPDDQKQGTSTVKKIIVNLVTSVAILAILPTVFGFLYDIQDAVINYNTIGTFFGYGSLNQNGPQYTGPTTNPEQISDEEYSANQIVNGVWKAFFSVDPDWCDGEVEENNPEINTDSPTARMEWCQEHIQAEEPFNLPQGDLLTYAANSNYVDLTASFGVYGGFAENASEGQIEFLWFLSLVGGVFLLYIAINYCFDMGIRLVKLVFYQVLAPIPIFMRIVPYGKISSTFNQWLKITLTCYLEVFVRIFIFYFVIYICTTIKNSEVLSLTLDNFGFFTKMFTYAFLYMGIFAFMKKSPKLLSEITGIDSGNMKLGLKEKFKESMSAIPGVGLATNLAKKTVAGVDAKLSGQKFSDGWKRVEGKGPVATAKKWFGGLLPYTAQTVENRKKADEQVAALEAKKEKARRTKEKFLSDVSNASPDVQNQLLEGGKTIKDLESGDYIKFLGLTSPDKYGTLAKAYKDRGNAKKKMLDAEAEYNAAKQSGDPVAIGQAAKKYNEFKDSYEAVDNEWKQMLNSSKYKDVNERFTSMKYAEDRAKGLLDESDNNIPGGGGYQATRGMTPGSQPNTTRVPVRPVNSNQTSNSQQSPTRIPVRPVGGGQSDSSQTSTGNAPNDTADSYSNRPNQSESTPGVSRVSVRPASNGNQTSNSSSTGVPVRPSNNGQQNNNQ